MPTHFPDDLFDNEDREELAKQVFSKLATRRVLRTNAKRMNIINSWFVEDDASVRSVVNDLADCPDADLAKTQTGRVYLTEEFLKNPDVSYTTYGDDE